jgi:hypothetical protein
LQWPLWEADGDGCVHLHMCTHVCLHFIKN